MSDPVFQGDAPQTRNGRRVVRADARRNRDKIVEMAAQIFAREGLEVPMDAIARRAGVGAGTLYRHFPTKQDLLGQVLAQRTTDLTRRCREIQGAALEPGEALERWLDALGQWMRSYDGLPGPLREAYNSSSSPLAPTCEEVIEMTRGFLEPAQRAGVARAEVDAAILYQAVLAVAWVASAVDGAGGGADDVAADFPGQGHGGEESRGGLAALVRRGWQRS
ncbi:TetR/AcrR family transcriptional regulator [Actinomyces qiguomingii]|uniref:TetR/AcrR family transcriptional regulator n=1 Tax=Actinomyces qiguomingii TaxID=2057800 RepID=UPI000CA0008B|nr:TetR/AcrR family transcriptional regulator [Actinomyces qiguomingii]